MLTARCLSCWPTSADLRGAQSRQLSEVLRTCQSNGRGGGFCEGFQTPAVTNIPTRTAAGVWKPPKDETAGRGTYWRCHALSYGDLALGWPQLGSAARVG